MVQVNHHLNGKVPAISNIIYLREKKSLPLFVDSVLSAEEVKKTIQFMIVQILRDRDREREKNLAT